MILLEMGGGGRMQIRKYYLSSTPEGTSNASLGVSQEETCFTQESTMCVMNAHQSQHCHKTGDKPGTCNLAI